MMFIDQPVGAGLSQADMKLSDPFPHHIRNVTTDLYNALTQLYNNSNGCFKKLGIKDSSPFSIFGNGYAGKYVSAIAAEIVYNQEHNNFMKGLKGVGIGDGFLHPEYMLREMSSYAYNLGLLQFNERKRIERKVINGTFQIRQKDMRGARQIYTEVVQ